MNSTTKKKNGASVSVILKIPHSCAIFHFQIIFQTLLTFILQTDITHEILLNHGEYFYGVNGNCSCSVVNAIIMGTFLNQCN